MGWRSQPTASVHLDKVFVPQEAMLGQQGSGFKVAMHALDGGRINIGACRWVGESVPALAFAADLCIVVQVVVLHAGGRGSE
jgi:alkylation response protein AidB-like acyl-CoA dehydrogenase